MCQKNGIKIEANQLIPPQMPVDPVLSDNKFNYSLLI